MGGCHYYLRVEDEDATKPSLKIISNLGERVMAMSDELTKPASMELRPSEYAPLDDFHETAVSGMIMANIARSHFGKELDSDIGLHWPTLVSLFQEKGMIVYYFTRRGPHNRVLNAHVQVSSAGLIGCLGPEPQEQRYVLSANGQWRNSPHPIWVYT